MIVVAPGLSLTGLGLSALTLFIRWRFPAVPHYVSSAGVVLAICLLVMPFFPSLRPFPALTMAAGMALLVSGIEWQVKLKAENPPQQPETAARVEPKPASVAPHNLVPDNIAKGGGSVADELALEQLAELRRRRAREEAEEARTRVEADKQLREKERLAYLMGGRAAADRLRSEYATKQGLSPELLSGQNQVSDDWMNRRLSELRLPFIYHGYANGSWSLEPAPGNPYYQPTQTAQP